MNEAAETTLEQDIAAAFEAAKAAESDPEPVVAPEASEEPESAPAAPDRGPDGKFKARETPAEAEEPAADDAEPAPIIPDRYGVAPNYAKKAIREHWAALPPEVRAELHEREREVHQQLTRQDDERTFGKKVREVVGPYEGFIRSLGAEPLQAVDYLIKTDYRLRTAAPDQRKALFLKAAADYGVSFAEGELNGAAHAAGDPRVETLQQRIDRLENEQRNATEAKQLAERRSIEQQIEDFAGRPENVYFDRVSPMMASLLSSGQAQTLEQAYDMAVYADPETRALQLAAQQAAEHSQRAEQHKAQAAAARRASVSVTGAPGPAVPASGPDSAGSLEDDIRNAIHAVSSRV